MTISVTDIMENFRAALVALLPMVERLGIPWRRGDAYDEWDNIASCLFEQLVESVVTWTLRSEDNLPAYDMMLPSYNEYNLIEVRHSALEPGLWVFHAFGTKRTPFDVVEVRNLSLDRFPRDKTLGECDVLGAQFMIRLRTGEIIETLEGPGDSKE
jgi:hypothetical protein